MPEVSRFYGIVIRLYYNDHNPPHFHARYGGMEAVIDIRTLAVISGRLPARPARHRPNPRIAGTLPQSPPNQSRGKSSHCVSSGLTRLWYRPMTLSWNPANIPTGESHEMTENELLERITVDPKIFGGKPIVRGRRLAVEQVLGMLAAGDSAEDILREYEWLEPEDIRACLTYARRVVGHERVEPPISDTAA